MQKKSIWFLFLLSIVYSNCYGLLGSDAPKKIKITGSADKLMVPDRVVMQILLNHKGEDLENIETAMKQTREDLLAHLEKAKIPSQEITLEPVHKTVIYPHHQGNDLQKVFYVTQEIEVSTKKVKELYEGMRSMNISPSKHVGVTFLPAKSIFEDLHSIEEELLEGAIQKTLQKSGIVAKEYNLGSLHLHKFSSTFEQLKATDAFPKERHMAFATHTRGANQVSSQNDFNKNFQVRFRVNVKSTFTD